MRVQIVGPITNDPNYKQEFSNAEEVLKAAGHIVINPIMAEGLGTREEYLQVTFNQILMADAIYVLPDSDGSIGAIAEQIEAFILNKPRIVPGKFGKMFQKQGPNEYIFKPQYKKMKKRIKKYLEVLPELEEMLIVSTKPDPESGEGYMY